MNREKLTMQVLSSYNGGITPAEKFGNDIVKIVDILMSSESGTFLEKLQAERDHMAKLHLEFKSSLTSAKVKALPKVELDLLTKQEHYMHEYLVVLNERLNRIKKAK